MNNSDDGILVGILQTLVELTNEHSAILGRMRLQLRTVIVLFFSVSGSLLGLLLDFLLNGDGSLLQAVRDYLSIGGG